MVLLYMNFYLFKYDVFLQEKQFICLAIDIILIKCEILPPHVKNKFHVWNNLPQTIHIWSFGFKNEIIYIVCEILPSHDSEK